MDTAHFQNTGEARLLPGCARAEARDAFHASLHNLDRVTYHPRFESLIIEEARD